MDEPWGEEFEALLWDLPDPSDCLFLPIFHEMEAAPEACTEKSSSDEVTTGNLSVQNEDSGSCDYTIKITIVEELSKGVSTPSANFMEGFSPADTEAGSSSESEPAASWIDAVESFLMGNDEVEGDTLQVEDTELFQGLLNVLVDDPSSSPVHFDALVPDWPADSMEEEPMDVSAGNDEEDLDAMKKRKRQLRNRDSALRSRERKKMYVKELEAKSRFMEVECRRLQQALALCYTENHALRLHVHLLEANRGVVAKQESAVLKMESLLLGSLLWLAMFVWWVLFPALERAPEARAMVMAREGKGAVTVLIVPTRGIRNRRGFGLPLSARFKAARKKMRADLFGSFRFPFLVSL